MSLDFETAKTLVTNPQYVATHQFLPFLSYEMKARRYRGNGKHSVKGRPIKYASHKDGYIYAYYSKLLSEQYEQKLQDLGLDDAVIAYRQGKGSNITFAKDAFDEIQRRGDCVAVALDISGFFNNIDHDNLKKEWSEVLGEQLLPSDHYRLFTSLTRWSHIDRDQCFERLGVTEKTVKRPLFKDKKYYRNVIKGRNGKDESLVESNKNQETGRWKNYGIPQGSPMSALLSNMYMLPFDKSMRKLADGIGIK